jgi:HlyD family secretion protein
MKNKTLIGVLLGIVVLLLIIAAIGKQKNWFGKGDLQQVAIEKSEKRAIVETVTASGKINPETEVKLSSEVSGEIIGLYVKEGDSVKKGDLLVEINPSIYEAQASQASANVSQVKANLLSAEATLKNQQTQFEQAQRNFERQKQLYNEKIISDQEFDQAKMSFVLHKRLSRPVVSNITLPSLPLNLRKHNAN